MANQNNNQGKAVIHVEVYPFEKEAYLKWIQGKYHSVAEAIRCHIRKVTGLDPESQENSESGHGDNQQGVSHAPESADEKNKGDGGGVIKN